MLERFYPREYMDSAYSIPYEEYYRSGMRGVIFDIDNTLVMHGAPADDRAIRLFRRLRSMGMKTCLLSNNKERRVKPFAGAVGSAYICRAGKPAVRGYRAAMEKMGTDAASTLFVGDQLFTDVYGANRAGIYGILTRPINPREEIQIVLKRRLEAIVLFFYRRRAAKDKRDGQMRGGEKR